MNIAEFARLIGVSKATVSYAINGRDNQISAATKQMVLTRMKELGYRPNLLARALATQHTRTIALWTYDVYPAYYMHVIYHIRQLLMSEDFELDIINLPPSAQSVSSVSWPVEGILAFGKSEAVKMMVATGLHRGTPIVDMGGGWESIDYVRINTYDAAVEAVEHFIRTGRRHIAYLQPVRVEDFYNERCVAYNNVMQEAGLETQFLTFDSPMDSVDRPTAREWIKCFMENGGCLDAILCTDDEAMIGVYRGLRDLGIRIPDDIALIGCDGIIDTEYHDPPLTTIIQPVQSMCEIAWAFLKNRMADPEIPHQQQLLNARLELRGSSNASAG